MSFFLASSSHPMISSLYALVGPLFSESPTRAHERSLPTEK
jgi:hypothetical protein